MDLKLGEKKYCWQRAVLKEVPNFTVSASEIGKIIWVFNVPPVNNPEYGSLNGGDNNGELMYYTNVKCPSERSLLGMIAEGLEFLARDEKDFSEDVELIELSDVSNQPTLEDK